MGPIAAVRAIAASGEAGGAASAAGAAVAKTAAMPAWAARLLETFFRVCGGRCRPTLHDCCRASASQATRAPPSHGPPHNACSLPARRQKFWPPTRQSAPQLLAGWLGLAYVLWIFIREKRNKAVEQVAAAQRRPAFASAALHCSGLHRKSRCSQH